MFEFVKSYYMDYAGQKLSEQIFQVITVFFGIVGFCVGYITQQLSHSMLVLGVGCVVAGLVTLPPWPMYRRDNIKWQAPRPEEETAPVTTKSNKSHKKRN